MTRLLCLLAVALLAGSLTGCMRGPKEQEIEVKASNDPLNAPRTVLERYAKGEPMGSEVTSFPYMVNEVRKTDPTRADILEKGLEDLQKEKDPANRKVKAKALLQKLAPSPTSG
jgi:hypothetical protein